MSTTTSTSTTTVAPPPSPPSPPPSPALEVTEEVISAAAAPTVGSAAARPNPNPPVPITADSIRQRSYKQRPIPVPKEVFKTMTTVGPSSSQPADADVAETTMPPGASVPVTTMPSTTSTSSTRPPGQPRPSIVPVSKGQFNRGSGGGRGRGQPDGQPDADPQPKNRGVAVSKQDFALGQGQEAKRVPTERELGVVPPGVGVLTYVLLALGVVPLALAGVCTARYFINRRKKVLDESDSSSELSCHRRTRVTRPDVSTTAKLPRPLPHLPTPPTPPKAWEDSDLEREQREQGERDRDREWDRDRVLQMPAPTRWEFPRDKLRLQTLLGQGNFGQVWKAEADDISGHHGLTRLVAVKTVKEGASVREREDLLRELGIMQQLGAHPNVVTLLGCCTEKEPFLLIMEYVMYGKLLAFLRDHRTRQDYYNFSEDSDALTSRDLTVFAFCVARGMEYLASKGVIHRDLAARNVLVDHNKLCKIADFGMSRSVRDSGCGQVYEQRETKGALPIRWMAPESLIYSVFTHKSDVWSFGILMWEIVTLGSTPYPTMGAREVLRRVRDGYRLERPAHCRPELFRIVLRCWHADPAKRPDFGELRRALADLLEDGVRAGSYVDLEGFAMDSNKASSNGGCGGEGRGS